MRKLFCGMYGFLAIVLTAILLGCGTGCSTPDDHAAGGGYDGPLRKGDDSLVQPPDYEVAPPSPGFGGQAP